MPWKCPVCSGRIYSGPPPTLGELYRCPVCQADLIVAREEQSDPPILILKLVGDPPKPKH